MLQLKYTGLLDGKCYKLSLLGSSSSISSYYASGSKFGSFTEILKLEVLLKIVLIGINVLKFDFVEFQENAMNIFQCLEMNDLQRQLFCSLPAAFAR